MYITYVTKSDIKLSRGKYGFYSFHFPTGKFEKTFRSAICNWLSNSTQNLGLFPLCFRNSFTKSLFRTITSSIWQYNDKATRITILSFVSESSFLLDCNLCCCLCFLTLSLVFSFLFFLPEFVSISTCTQLLYCRARSRARYASPSVAFFFSLYLFCISAQDIGILVS